MKNDYGRSTLFTAVMRDQTEVATTLIEAKCDVHTHDCHDNTALQIATRNKNVECMKFLIDAGVQLDLKNKDGTTALMRAENLESAQLLLDAGCHPDLR